MNFSFFPIAEGKVKLSGGEHFLRTSKSIRESPRHKEIFQENQTGRHHKTHRQVTVKQEVISGQFQETTYTVITLNRESNFTCQEKSHSQSHCDTLMWPGLQVRPWTQCWKAAQTNSGTLKVTSIYQIRGQGSHDSHAGWKTSRRMYVVRGAADNEAKNIHADHLRLEIWINMTDAAQRKEKQKWAIGSSTMRESWEWFLSLIRQMQSSRKPLKTNWKSRKFRCQQVRLARSGEESTGDLLRGTCDTRKTKYACIVEADESTRKRWERTLHKDHKDHVAGKEISSLNHYNLVHEFIHMPQAMKVLEAKAAVDKEWEKLEKKAWQLTKVGNKEEVIDEARREGKTVRLWWIPVISRIRSWNQNIKNTKVESCSEVKKWKMIQALTQYLQSKVRQGHRWQLQK